jgi:hypothetical protein
MMQTLLGVPEVAKTLRTNENKVLGLIRSGELPAINLAQSATGKRPRWRIAADDLNAFLASRRTAKVQQETPPRKAKPKKRVFFP